MPLPGQARSTAAAAAGPPSKARYLNPILSVASCAVSGLLLSALPAAHASSSSADSVHFHAHFDHEQWRRDSPLPAAKGLADLDVGEPRTVRMIYFLPEDWPYRAEVVDSMKTVIRQVQSFYGEEMQAHGYGNRTFRVETDASGEPLVHRVDGQHPFSHYDNTLGRAVVAELEQSFDLDANIYFIVFGVGSSGLRQGDGSPAAGVGIWRTKNGGDALVTDDFWVNLVAHELGHAFGLSHDLRYDGDVLESGLRQLELSACGPEYLAVHTYFNADSPIAEGPSPTIELVSPAEYPAGSESVSIRLRVSDPAGVHQVGLLVYGSIGPEVKACRGLAGETEAVIEFEYDGVHPSDGTSSLSTLKTHRMGVDAVDRDGNVHHERFILTEISPSRIAAVKGHTGWVRSVSLSPDGATLATASEDETFKVWDGSTLAHIATLDNREFSANAVSYSPDGRMIATGTGVGARLWDASTFAHVATLGRSSAFSVSFSPDGATLAVGTSVGTIELWDLATEDQIATLRAHPDQIVNSVSFSPDGRMLASGSHDNTVKLWDVATQANTATFEVQDFGVWSVSFSPDGATLAVGTYGTIELWDVASEARIAVLEQGAGVNSVSFSPDGTILAAGSDDGALKLWDVLTGEDIDTFGHRSSVSSVSFSPDGRTLASGASDGTTALWDISRWTQPRPFSVEIVSGDDQRAAPGAALAEPLVVEVRDQYDDPLPDVAVTLTVTAGDGKLGGRFAVVRDSTDAGGRAEITLTLGPFPGGNTVGVSIGGRELATFHAEGVGTTVAELEGDYRTWHLPDAATVRLGKGAIGEGDGAVAFSSDGQSLAVASGIGVWLYETTTSRPLGLLPAAAPVHSVAFSLDGTLAAGTDYGRVELWEVKTATRVSSLRHADWGRVTSVVFSPDGTALASGSWDQVVKVWDVETGRQAAVWDGDPDRSRQGFLSVAFSADGATLVSGFVDGTVRFWDVATQTELAVLEGHRGAVAAVTFSPDGARVASAGSRQDPTVRLWDVATRREVATLAGHDAAVRAVSFASPGGATLASGSTDGTVKLWDVATGGLITTLYRTAGVRSVRFSADGTLLASGAADGTVLLQDVETGNAEGLSGHHSLSSMAFSPDGTLLASGHPDGKVVLWDSAAQARIAGLKGHAAGVSAVSFSPDGTTLVSGSMDGEVRLWDVGRRSLTAAWQGHATGVLCLAFSSGGVLLATGSWDHTVKLWDVARRELMSTLEGHTAAVRSVAFSPDRTLLASGGDEDPTVRLWDVATGEPTGTPLKGHQFAVLSASFGPDGRTLASGSFDSDIRLWDVATRTTVSTLNPPRWELGLLAGVLARWDHARLRVTLHGPPVGLGDGGSHHPRRARVGGPFGGILQRRRCPGFRGLGRHDPGLGCRAGAAPPADPDGAVRR